MTVLEQLNEKLNQVPEFAEQVIANISKADWSDLKKEHATEVVEQLQHNKLVDVIASGKYVYFIELKLYLTPCEVNISKGRVYSMGEELREYIVNLLTDLNQISPNIKFNYSGHDLTDLAYTKPGKFYIRWEV